MNQKSIIATSKNDATRSALHNTLFVSARFSNEKINFRLNGSGILWIIHFIFIWKRKDVFNSEFYGAGLRQGRVHHG